MYPRVHPRVCIVLVSGSHMKASVLLGFILYRVSSIPTWFQVHDVVEDDLECLVLLPLPPSPVFSSAEGIRMYTQVWSSLSLSLCLFFCLSLSLSLSLRVSLCFSVFLEIVFGCIDQTGLKLCDSPAWGDRHATPHPASPGGHLWLWCGMCVVGVMVKVKCCRSPKWRQALPR